MSADAFQGVADIAKRSRIAGAGRRAVEGIRMGASQSVLLATFGAVGAQVRALTPTERVRLGGVAILVATMTQALLLQWSFSVVRPGAPALLRVVTAAAALLMIVLAEPIAIALAGSRIRQLFARAVTSQTPSTRA